MSALPAGTFAYLNGTDVVVDQQGVVDVATVADSAYATLTLVGFTPDHAYLVAYSTSFSAPGAGRVVVWSADLASENTYTPLGAAWVRNATIEPGTGYIVLHTAEAALRRVDPATGAVVEVLPVSAPPFAAGIEFSPDGGLMVLARGDGLDTVVYETAGWTPVATLPIGSSNSPKFSRDGSTLWIRGNTGLFKYATAGWAGGLFKAFASGGPNSGISTSADDSLVCAFDRLEAGQNAPTVWSASTGALAYDLNLNAASAAFTGVGTEMVTSNDDTDFDGVGAVLDIVTGVIARHTLIAGLVAPVVAPPYAGPVPVTPPFWTNRIKTTEII